MTRDNALLIFAERSEAWFKWRANKRSSLVGWLTVFGIQLVIGFVTFGLFKTVFGIPTNAVSIFLWFAFSAATAISGPVFSVCWALLFSNLLNVILGLFFGLWPLSRDWWISAQSGWDSGGSIPHFAVLALLIPTVLWAVSSFALHKVWRMLLIKKLLGLKAKLSQVPSGDERLSKALEEHQVSENEASAYLGDIPRDDQGLMVVGKSGVVQDAPKKREIVEGDALYDDLDTGSTSARLAGLDDSANKSRQSVNADGTVGDAKDFASDLPDFEEDPSAPTAPPSLSKDDNAASTPEAPIPARKVEPPKPILMGSGLSREREHVLRSLGESLLIDLDREASREQGFLKFLSGQAEIVERFDDRDITFLERSEETHLNDLAELALQVQSNGPRLVQSFDAEVERSSNIEAGLDQEIAQRGLAGSQIDDVKPRVLSDESASDNEAIKADMTPEMQEIMKDFDNIRQSSVPLSSANEAQEETTPADDSFSPEEATLVSSGSVEESVDDADGPAIDPHENETLSQIIGDGEGEAEETDLPSVVDLIKADAGTQTNGKRIASLLSLAASTMLTSQDSQPSEPDVASARPSDQIADTVGSKPLSSDDMLDQVLAKMLNTKNDVAQPGSATSPETSEAVDTGDNVGAKTTDVENLDPSSEGQDMFGFEVATAQKINAEDTDAEETDAEKTDDEEADGGLPHDSDTSENEIKTEDDSDNDTHGSGREDALSEPLHDEDNAMIYYDVDEQHVKFIYLVMESSQSDDEKVKDLLDLQNRFEMDTLQAVRSRQFIEHFDEARGSDTKNKVTTLLKEHREKTGGNPVEVFHKSAQDINSRISHLKSRMHELDMTKINIIRHDLMKMNKSLENVGESWTIEALAVITNLLGELRELELTIVPSGYLKDAKDSPTDSDFNAANEIMKHVSGGDVVKGQSQASRKTFASAAKQISDDDVIRDELEDMEDDHASVEDDETSSSGDANASSDDGSSVASFSDDSADQTDADIENDADLVVPDMYEVKVGSSDPSYVEEMIKAARINAGRDVIIARKEAAISKRDELERESREKLEADQLERDRLDNEERDRLQALEDQRLAEVNKAKADLDKLVSDHTEQMEQDRADIAQQRQLLEQKKAEVDDLVTSLENRSSSVSEAEQALSKSKDDIVAREAVMAENEQQFRMLGDALGGEIRPEHMGRLAYVANSFGAVINPKNEVDVPERFKAYRDKFMHLSLNRIIQRRIRASSLPAANMRDDSVSERLLPMMTMASSYSFIVFSACNDFLSQVVQDGKIILSDDQGDILDIKDVSEIAEQLENEDEKAFFKQILIWRASASNELETVREWTRLNIQDHENAMKYERIDATDAEAIVQKNRQLESEVARLRLERDEAVLDAQQATKAANASSSSSAPVEPQSDSADNVDLNQVVSTPATASELSQPAESFDGLEQIEKAAKLFTDEGFSKNPTKVSREVNDHRVFIGYSKEMRDPAKKRSLSEAIGKEGKSIVFFTNSNQDDEITGMVPNSQGFVCAIKPLNEQTIMEFIKEQLRQANARQGN